ncbi:DegV family protein [Muricomes intestini]|jgi:DegV family protein with EDD domain|uniref:DegV family protein n=1 Tax=Muricomes intestini TaxID=1796634 RepID=UPI002FE41DCD
MIRVIADSTCDIAEELLKDYDLITLPLVITAEGKEYLDGVDLRTEQVYELMKQGILPGTAQIPYDIIHVAFEDCCKRGNDFLYISFSSKMSGCFSFANVVAKELREEYPDIRMELVDSQGGSAATGLIVLQALKMAKAKSSMEEILTQVRFMIEHVEHIFTIADLSWMVKGGRINKPLGFVGSVLNIRPWLDVESGKMVVKGMVRGEKKAISTVAEEVIKRSKQFQTQLIAITHAGDTEAAKKIEKLLKEALPACRTVISQIGGVLGVHLGMGGIGVFFFNERPSEYRL